MSDMIKDLLCNEENGIYFRLREGDYRLEETEKIKILDYAKEVFALLNENNIRVEMDDREEKLGYRIREAQMKKIPYQLVLGDSERDNKTVTYRHYGQQQQTTVSLEEFVCMLKNEIASK